MGKAWTGQTNRTGIRKLMAQASKISLEELSALVWVALGPPVALL